MNDHPNASDSNTPKLPSNFNALTFKAACPSCGAPVEFASAGSVMAVCEYCQTTVIREGDGLKAQGKQSLVIDDYSPLQIGSVGHIEGTDFALIGRIQLRYEQGVWNEWYVQFADGRNGWLSEALGQYSLTYAGAQARLSPYNDLSVNDIVPFEGVDYRVTDRRSAEAIAGEGELPFVMGQGWQTWVIDAQYKRQFITLDYGESGEESWPIVYKGQAVELADLDMKWLKTDDKVNADAGQAGSESGLNDADVEDESVNAIIISKIECPNCGSPIPYIEGKTDFLICPACHTESKLAGNTAEMLEVHSAMQHFNSSLPLGAKARIAAKDIAGVAPFSQSSQSSLANQQSVTQTDYHDYVIIGIMRLNEVGETSQWTEYLLYSLSNGFLWLSEESDGWYVSRVLSEMPEIKGRSLLYDNRQWQLLYESYQNRVIFAIGAFNWQVKVNDRNTLMDYGNGEDIITSEQTSREITYTIAQPLAYSKLKDWFGDYLSEASSATRLGTKGGSLKGLLTWHFIGQFIVLFVNGGSIITAIIVAILIFILYFSRASTEVDSRDPFQYHSTGVKLLSIILIVLGLLFSLAMGANSRNSAGTIATNSRNGGGIILLPGNGSSNSGRGGFSSGGSHK